MGDARDTQAEYLSLRGSQRRWLQDMRMRQLCGFPFFPEVPLGAANNPIWSCFGPIPFIVALLPEDTPARASRVSLADPGEYEETGGPPPPTLAATGRVPVRLEQEPRSLTTYPARKQQFPCMSLLTSERMSARKNID